MPSTYQALAGLISPRSSILSNLRSIGNLWGIRREVYQPILNRLGEVNVPTLDIWGAQDRILPLEHANQAVERLPNARLHIFDSCGHVPNIEHPDEFNALVLDFLSGSAR